MCVCIALYIYLRVYILSYVDLKILKHKYTALLQAFPIAHLSTLECLQDNLTDDCICAVVESTNVGLANKMMLDCMISKLTCKEDLLDFFDQLEEIKNAHNLTSTVNKLRQGMYVVYLWCTLRKPYIVILICNYVIILCMLINM